MFRAAERIRCNWWDELKLYRTQPQTLTYTHNQTQTQTCSNTNKNGHTLNKTHKKNVSISKNSHTPPSSPQVQKASFVLACKTWKSSTEDSMTQWLNKSRENRVVENSQLRKIIKLYEYGQYMYFTSKTWLRSESSNEIKHYIC